MPTVRELAESLWTGQNDALKSNPLGDPIHEGEEILDGIFYFKGMASSVTFDTGEGLVMLDTSTPFEAELLHKAVRRWRPAAPLLAVVFSHHHLDHAFGLESFDRESETQGAPRPHVYAQEGVARNLRRYAKTLGWNTAINMRQFALGPEFPSWPNPTRFPDTEYTNQIEFSVGDLTFELHHGRGETDDATWTWVRQKELLHCGDFFIWTLPNAGNPQKVQRYVGDWAVALREMAAHNPETLIPGHGLPIFGHDRIQLALLETAAFLEELETRVLALMNRGLSLDGVLAEFKFPGEMATSQYLKPLYDHPEFLVHGIWRQYGGWYDGEPDNLLPARRAEQAAEWVELSGGVGAVVERAMQLAAESRYQLACHLIEFAVLADPNSPTVHKARAEIYSATSQLQSSFMARNILNHAALASAQGKRDLAVAEPTAEADRNQ